MSIEEVLNDMPNGTTLLKNVSDYTARIYNTHTHYNSLTVRGATAVEALLKLKVEYEAIV